MRIQAQSQSIEPINSSNKVDMNSSKESIENKQSEQEDVQVISKEQLHQAIDTMNEIFEINQSELKFVFHEGLKEYFAQLVDSKTEEVVKEIPSKKLLDAFYEMQKLVGMIIDEKI